MVITREVNVVKGPNCEWNIKLEYFKPKGQAG